VALPFVLHTPLEEAEQPQAQPATAPFVLHTPIEEAPPGGIVAQQTPFPQALPASLPAVPTDDYWKLLSEAPIKAYAGLLDLLANTPQNLINLAKAGVGTAAIAAGRPEWAPEIEQPEPILTRLLEKKGIISAEEPKTIPGRLLDIGTQMAATGGINPAAILRKGAGEAARQVAQTAAATGGTEAGVELARAAPESSILRTVAPLVGAVAGGRLVPGGAAAAEGVREATLREAKQAGYVIPPTLARPTWINRLLEGLAGKLTTEQMAALKNQPVTNELVRRSLGLPSGTPLDREVLADIRREAGKAYEAVKGAGTLTADAHLVADADRIFSVYSGAARDFPALARPDVQTLTEAIKAPSFGADSAIDAIRRLRDEADKAFRSGDSGLGLANREAAAALERRMERHLATTGQRSLLDDYRKARALIARTYSVEEALNPATGDVIASKLARQLQQKKPLTSELKTVAKTGAAMPRAMQEVTRSMPGLSPLDYFWGTVGGAGGMAATGNPLGLLAAALPVARPMTRALILSRPYQAAMTRPLVPRQWLSELGEALTNPRILTPAIMANQPDRRAVNQLLLPWAEQRLR
jgi:hypothetical protein